MNRTTFKSLGLVAALVIGLSAQNVYAGGAPGSKDGSPANGGANASPVDAVKNTTVNTWSTVVNTYLANENFLRYMDQITGLFRRQEEASKVNAMYLATQMQNMFASQAGQNALLAYAPSVVNGTLQHRSISYASFAGQGKPKRRALTGFQTTSNEKCCENGACPTVVGTFCAISKVCQSGAATTSMQQRLCPPYMQAADAGIKKFATFNPDEAGNLLIKTQAGGGPDDYTGAVANPGVFLNKAQGCNVDSGAPCVRAIAATLASLRVGGLAEAKRVAMGAKNIRELLIAEAMEMKTGKYAAYFPDEKGNLLLKVDAEGGAGSRRREAMLYGAEVGGGNSSHQFLTSIGCTLTGPIRGGSNPYQASCQMHNAQAQGAPCPAGDGRYPSEAGYFELTSAATEYAGMTDMGERQSPSEAGASARQTNGNIQLANLGRTNSCSGSGADMGAFTETYQLITSILMSPEYAYFIDHLDEKKRERYAALAAEDLKDFDAQVAMNMRNLRFEDEGVKFIVENEETIRKQTSLASLFRDSGVDIASLTPIVNGNKFAAIVPTKSDILLTPASIMQAQSKDPKDPMGLLKLISTAAIPVAPAKQ